MDSKDEAVSPSLNSESASKKVNGTSVVCSSKTLKALFGSNISIKCFRLILLMNRYDDIGTTVPDFYLMKSSLYCFIILAFPVFMN